MLLMCENISCFVSGNLKVAFCTSGGEQRICSQTTSAINLQYDCAGDQRCCKREKLGMLTVTRYSWMEWNVKICYNNK